MDSPVIVDAASKFGRENDLDRSFPGFPFDEDADIFERPRSDGIRAHLDDLAARHPELAEHLRGPPWPFGGSLLRDRRRRRRGSGSSSNDDQQQRGQQHQVDEDARSQASGSSAASGASAVSSHSGGEPDLTSSSAIPQYGLRNTVDIGQQQRRRDMETSPEKSERGQRSMSAPPENRQQQQQQGQQQQPQPGQRFVSRVDITPQHNQQQQRAQSPGKPTSNVRHIPIFVEGRDEPVLSKVPTDFHHQQREQSPPHHFQRPSHFNDHFSKQQWPPSHFQEAFYKPTGFEQPIRRQQQFQQPQHHHQQQQFQQPQHHHQQQQFQQHQQPQYHQQQQAQQFQNHQQQQEQEIPKPKPPVPKDPLEKVAEVQKEVDDLAEMVRRYIGGKRQDKEYIYLDEMLTRELIKLDDIETEGRENVRQARKNAIKTIQDTISLLETKAPLADQQEQSATQDKDQEEHRAEEMDQQEISQIQEPMDVDAKQNNEPIPLPPAPSSPTKTKVESSENESTTMAVEFANQNVAPTIQQDTERTDTDIKQKTEQKVENRAVKNMEQLVAPTSMDKVMKRIDETSEESKLSDGKDGAATQTTTENKDMALEQQAEGKMKVDGEQRSATKSPMQKKAKKTKKKEQQPVSEQAIPLPPPPPSTESAK